jgi:hypothetical protein
MIYQKYENPDGLNKHQLWLLATSAMLSHTNRERHDTLLPLGDMGTQAQLESSQRALKRDYDVVDLPGLADTLKYFDEIVTFKAIQYPWEFNSEKEFKAFSVINTKDKSFPNVVDMVRKYQFDLPESDQAWHYGRCSWLIRHAYYSGYINEAEAWQLLEENVGRIRKIFESWESFGISYIAGAQYWKRANYTENAISTYKRNLVFLLTNKNSPWVRLSWNDFKQ